MIGVKQVVTFLLCICTICTILVATCFSVSAAGDETILDWSYGSTVDSYRASGAFTVYDRSSSVDFYMNANAGEKGYITFYIDPSYTISADFDITAVISYRLGMGVRTSSNGTQSYSGFYESASIDGSLNSTLLVSDGSKDIYPGEVSISNTDGALAYEELTLFSEYNLGISRPVQGFMLRFTLNSASSEYNAVCLRINRVDLYGDFSMVEVPEEDNRLGDEANKMDDAQSDIDAYKASDDDFDSAFRFDIDTWISNGHANDYYSGFSFVSTLFTKIIREINGLYLILFCSLTIGIACYIVGRKLR